MKTLGGLLLVLAICFSLTAFQARSKGGSNVEQAITQLEDGSRDAALKGDASWGEKYTSDDFIRITADGRMLNRQQFLDDLKSSKFQSIEFSDRKIRVYGDSAVVNATAKVKATNKDKDISGTYRGTRVWEKTKGEWKLVNFQTTRVAQ